MPLERDQNSPPTANANESNVEDLQRARSRLAEVHAWRRRLHPRYHGAPEIEAALDVFSDAFINVAGRLDLETQPIRRFLEKSRGAKELSPKGAEVIAMKERFRLSPRVMADSAAYLVRSWEQESKGFSGVDVIKKDCHLDAPFGYALEFRNSDGNWEVIALAAALPDFSNKTLIIRELQGSGGIKRLTSEAVGVRGKFNTAVNVPFIALAQLAAETGLSVVKVTKTPAWKQKIAGQIDSPYVQIPRRFHMDAGSDEDDYFSIETDKLLKM